MIRTGSLLKIIVSGSGTPKSKGFHESGTPARSWIAIYLTVEEEHGVGMDETHHAEQEILLKAGLLVGILVEFHRLKVFQLNVVKLNCKEREQFSYTESLNIYRIQTKK
jgi:hypothetical protein